MQYGVGNDLVMQAARILGARAIGASAPVIYDSFTAPDGTPITAHIPDICPVGSVWTHLIGLSIPTIQSQKLQSLVTVSTDAIECGVSDATINVVADYNSNINTLRAIAARCVDGTHYWMFRHYAGFMSIIEVNTSSITRASMAYAPPNGTETMTVILLGNLLTFTVGANTLSYTSTVFNAATKHGLRGQSYATGPINIAFDDFMVMSS